MARQAGPGYLRLPGAGRGQRRPDRSLVRRGTPAERSFCRLGSCRCRRAVARKGVTESSRNPVRVRAPTRQLPPVGVERTTLVTLRKARSAGWPCLAPESARDLFPKPETLYAPHRPVKCLFPCTFSIACATQMPLAGSEISGSIFEKFS